jgi:hypothetical protein
VEAIDGSLLIERRRTLEVPGFLPRVAARKFGYTLNV